VKLPAKRVERERLYEARAYRREAILAALGRTGLTMSVRQLAELTGYGPGVELDLELMAERGTIGKVGKSFFPLPWAQAS
jgi:hypothetical protein